MESLKLEHARSWVIKAAADVTDRPEVEDAEVALAALDSLRWRDPQKERPQDGETVITEDFCGNLMIMRYKAERDEYSLFAAYSSKKSMHVKAWRPLMAPDQARIQQIPPLSPRREEMLNERDAAARRLADLIEVISSAGDRYGSRLLDFMERYGLQGLAQATEEQLRECIKAEVLT